MIPLATGHATPLFFEEAKKQVGASSFAISLFGLRAPCCGQWDFDLIKEKRAIGMLHGYRV